MPKLTRKVTTPALVQTSKGKVNRPDSTRPTKVPTSTLLMAAIIPAVVLPRHIKDLTVSTVHHPEPQVMLGGRHAVPINTAHFLIEVAHPPLAAPVAQRASRERAESRPPG